MTAEEIEAKKKIAGDKKPSMKRRSEQHDYRGKRFYMITLEVKDRMPILGTLVGDETNASIALSPLGEAVAKEWENIPHYYPKIKMIAHQVMPDHFHGILYVSGTTEYHLGQVIKGFKVGCNRTLREILKGNAITDVALETQRTREGTEAGAVEERPGVASETQRTREEAEEKEVEERLGVALKTQRTMEGAEEKEDERTAAFRSKLLSYAAILSQPTEHATLWSQGYNDKILHNYSTLDKWKAYLQDNPHRLALRKAHPDYFRVRFGVKVGAQQYAAIGNRFLLQRPEKVQIQLSRSLTQEEIDEKINYYLSLARQGSILVSPAISKGEQAVMRAALNEHLPIIFLTPWGFNEFSKPGHQYYDACSEGRFLILAPWEHQNERVPLTRSMCLTLNEMTYLICNL